MNAAVSRWHGRPVGPLLAKTCRGCGELKQADEFYAQTGGALGRLSTCKACVCRKTNARTKERRDERKARGLRHGPYNQHGLSDEDFLRLMAQGRCDACDAADPGSAKGWHIDHDHACCPGGKSRCGKCVRGLLCHPCNTSLGMLGDSPERILLLAQYILRVLQRDDLSSMKPMEESDG